jgi:hypothetical protein
MNRRCQLESPRKARRALLVAGGFLCCAGVAGIVTARPDEPTAELVGTIEGETISIEGPMKVEVVRNEIRTMLRSGSDVRVKAGAARIDLIEGGVIAICGPAHFSVLKSHGSLTVALDSGIIHVHIEREPGVTVYTPQIQAKPIAIGGAAQDALVGLDAAGAMCLRATSGAIRLEQQLTGQTLIVPQGGDVVLNNGQIDSLHAGGGHCACEPPAARPVPPEVSTIASTEELRTNASAVAKPKKLAEKPPVQEEPIYQVFMPPLAFDASAKVQPEPDPRLIVLVRRVRVRPALIYRGRVEGEAVAAASTAPPAATQPAAAAPKKAAPPANEGVFDRVRSFFRRIWGGS